jgi:hypothetical protein
MTLGKKHFCRISQHPLLSFFAKPSANLGHALISTRVGFGALVVASAFAGSVCVMPSSRDRHGCSPFAICPKQDADHGDLSGMVRALRQSTLNYPIVADMQHECERTNFVVACSQAITRLIFLHFILSDDPPLFELACVRRKNHSVAKIVAYFVQYAHCCGHRCTIVCHKGESGAAGAKLAH